MQVFDNGVNPKDSEPDEAANSSAFFLFLLLLVCVSFTSFDLSWPTLVYVTHVHFFPSLPSIFFVDGAVRCELGSVMYAANVLGSRGPRKMQVALPGMNTTTTITSFVLSSLDCVTSSLIATPFPPIKAKC